MTRRKSNAQKKLEGTFRRDRHKNEVERGRVMKAPTPPKTLPADAKKLWRKVCAEMVDAGTLSTADLPALETVCQAWSNYWAACKELNELGFTSEGSMGQLRKSPAGEAALAWYRAAMKGFEQFGLTPQSRGKVEVLPGPKEDNVFAGLNGLDRYLERR